MFSYSMLRFTIICLPVIGFTKIFFIEVSFNTPILLIRTFCFQRDGITFLRVLALHWHPINAYCSRGVVWWMGSWIHRQEYMWENKAECPTTLNYMIFSGMYKENGVNSWKTPVRLPRTIMTSMMFLGTSFKVEFWHSSCSSLKLRSTFLQWKTDYRHHK